MQIAQKLEAADAFLTELVQKLFKDKACIAQSIPNSHVWGTHFDTYAAGVEGSVSERVKNVGRSIAMSRRRSHEDASCCPWVPTFSSLCTCSMGAVMLRRNAREDS